MACSVIHIFGVSGVFLLFGSSRFFRRRRCLGGRCNDKILERGVVQRVVFMSMAGWL